MEFNLGFSSHLQVSGDDFPGLPCVTEAVFDHMVLRALSVLVLNLHVSGVVVVDNSVSFQDGGLG